MRTPLALLLFVLATAATPATSRAQSATRLYLLVLEEDGGQFRKAFADGLGRIPDIVLVNREEDAELRLSVLAICVPRGASCANVVTSAVSVTFEEPLSAAELFEAMRESADSSATVRRLGFGEQVAIAEALHGELLPYRRVLRRFVASWGRSVVGGAIDETVTEFDARCLARRRLRDQARREQNAGDVAAAHALHWRLEEQPERWWSC